MSEKRLQEHREELRPYFKELATRILYYQKRAVYKTLYEKAVNILWAETIYTLYGKNSQQATNNWLLIIERNKEERNDENNNDNNADGTLANPNS